MFIFLLFIIFTFNSSSNPGPLLLFGEKVVYIKFNEPLRMTNNIKTFQEFCLKQEILEAQQDYKIKVSCLGSIGLVVKSFWKVPNQELIQMLSKFKPMDTISLDFTTDEKAQILGFNATNEGDYCFYVVGYRDTLARTKEAELLPFDYIIKLEHLILNNPPYALFQYILCIVLATIASFIIFWQVNKNSKLREFLIISPKQIKEE